jgi:hypothetical protein
MRKIRNQPSPSGMSPNEAHAVPQVWGGRDCLIPVDVSAVRRMKEDLGGEALLESMSLDYSMRARAIYDTLGIVNLSYEKVWDVLATMYAQLRL